MQEQLLFEDLADRNVIVKRASGDRSSQTVNRFLPQRNRPSDSGLRSREIDPPVVEVNGNFWQGGNIGRSKPTVYSKQNSGVKWLIGVFEHHPQLIGFQHSQAVLLLLFQAGLANVSFRRFGKRLPIPQWLINQACIVCILEQNPGTANEITHRSRPQRFGQRSPISLKIRRPETGDGPFLAEEAQQSLAALVVVGKCQRRQFAAVHPILL